MLIDKIKDTIAFLKKDEIKNLSIISILENEPESIISIEKIGNAVAAKRKDDIFISCYTKEEALHIKNIFPDIKAFSAIEDWLLPIFVGDKETKWFETTYKLYLPKNVKIPEPKNIIKPLKESDAKIIYENWTFKETESIDYVRESITKRYGRGIYKDDKLIGWIAIHDDDALGFLYVFEEYRRNGYAKDLLYSAINEVRKKGKIPFAYVVPENIKSLNLVLGMGFVKDCKICWVRIK